VRICRRSFLLTAKVRRIKVLSSPRRFASQKRSCGGQENDKGLFLKDTAMAGRLKSYFLRGLAVLIPTVVTIWIFVWGYNFIYEKMGVHVKEGLEYLIRMAGGSEQELGRFWVEGFLSAAGFVIALAAILVLGAFLASVVGRAIWRQIERFIMNTPLLKQVFPYVKQITDFFLTQDETKQMFSKVVAVEFPRKGVWSIGFVTGSGIKRIADNTGKEYLTVFIATTPSPLTGFTMVVPKEEVLELDMKIEEAFRFIVSAGLIAPTPERKLER